MLLGRSVQRTHMRQVADTQHGTERLGGQVATEAMWGGVSL